jgi:hypothetical protein
VLGNCRLVTGLDTGNTRTGPYQEVGLYFLDIIGVSEYERPSGLSNVDDGGGDVLRLESRRQSVRHWLIRDQLTVSQVELPTEVRKDELGEHLADSQHFLRLDYRFKSFMWEIKHMRSGSGRNQVIERFWKRVYEGHHVEDMDRLRSGVSSSMTSYVHLMS